MRAQSASVMIDTPPFASLSFSFSSAALPGCTAPRATPLDTIPARVAFSVGWLSASACVSTPQSPSAPSFTSAMREKVYATTSASDISHSVVTMRTNSAARSRRLLVGVPLTSHSCSKKTDCVKPSSLPWPWCCIHSASKSGVTSPSPSASTLWNSRSSLRICRRRIGARSCAEMTSMSSGARSFSTPLRSTSRFTSTSACSRSSSSPPYAASRTACLAASPFAPSIARRSAAMCALARSTSPRTSDTTVVYLSGIVPSSSPPPFLRFLPADRPRAAGLRLPSSASNRRFPPLFTIAYGAASTATSTPPSESCRFGPRAARRRAAGDATFDADAGSPDASPTFARWSMHRDRWSSVSDLH
mmetsp:Transcript_4203/g.15503  ORF Transcript_4203/g.15503 Transcript_4203/m.15503 type:complete len:360 (-) Transcript_4203:272-1351(-)